MAFQSECYFRQKWKNTTSLGVHSKALTGVRISWNALLPETNNQPELFLKLIETDIDDRKTHICMLFLWLREHKVLQRLSFVTWLFTSILMQVSITNRLKLTGNYLYARIIYVEKWASRSISLSLLRNEKYIQQFDIKSITQDNLKKRKSVREILT